jgi:hypothetical protein
VRAGATPDQIVNGLARIIGDKPAVAIVITRHTVDQDVILVDGKPKSGANGEPTTVQITLPGSGGNRGGSGPLRDMLRTLSEQTGYTFLNQNGNLRDSYNFSMTGGDPATKLDAQALTDLLKSLTDQTGLTFRQETRPLRAWTLKPDAGTPPPAGQLP